MTSEAQQQNFTSFVCHDQSLVCFAYSFHFSGKNLLLFTVFPPVVSALDYFPHDFLVTENSFRPRLVSALN